MAIDAVVIRKLTKRYGTERALAAVDLELAAGSVCAVLGHNGAGKSTLLGICSTLVRPTSGEVVYQRGGVDVPMSDELRRDIGVLAHQSLCYGELSAIENLELVAGLYDLAADARAITAMLDEVGLDERARTRPARTYSRGMVQRLALARALLPRPSLVLLDEPFTGLDHDGTAQLAQRIGLLKAAGAIVLVVTHDLDAVAGLVDHAVVLAAGRAVRDEQRAEARGQLAGYALAELQAIYADGRAVREPRRGGRVVA